MRPGKRLFTLWLPDAEYREWFEAARDNQHESCSDFVRVVIGDAIGEYRERNPQDRRQRSEPVNGERRATQERRSAAC